MLLLSAMKSQPTNLVSSTVIGEDYFQLILDNIEEAFVLLDKDFNILQTNRKATEELRQYFGARFHTGAEYIGFMEAAGVPNVSQLFESILKGQSHSIQSVLTNADGMTTYIEYIFLPARNTVGDVFGIIVYSKDITEKKKAELAIKEAEERWQFALDASEQAAWDWNMQTNKIIYSSSYKKMYGFVEGDLSNDISEWYSRIHPEDQKKIEVDLQKHLHSENPYYETTYRIQLKNGDYKWILARGKLLEKDKEGKPLRMIGTHTDLTKTLKAEEDIKKMNERFIYASKASAQALWEWDAITGQAYVSPSFTEIFGWEADENNYFEQWHQYVHPDDKKRIIGGYYQTLAATRDAIWEASYRFLKKDGSYAIVSDRAYILRDDNGKAMKVIGATQDVTAQKRIEEELFKSNERYNLMMEATNELLWEWDIMKNEVYRSKNGLKHVYGLDDDSEVKTHEQWMQRIHPDDLPTVKESLTKIFNGENKQHFEIEYRFLNGDNGYNHLHGRGILLTDEDGKPVRLIGTEQNVTERKRLEQELLENELEYKKLINQATVDSQEQERSEIGRELHDNVNQVLTTAKLYLELAISNADMQAELLKKASKNISTVINEIRQLSRSLMDPTLGDLGLVDSIKDLIENINLTQKVRIGLQINEAIENVLDRKQKLTIFRIIQESLNNVIRHAKAKQVSISIQLRNERICFKIIDDGVGFSQESTKKGAGLKNITNRVYLINGEFRIKSQPGQGCEINICFPIK